MGVFVRTAPLRNINPHFSRRITRSRVKKTALAAVAGYPHAEMLHNVLQMGRVAATRLTVERLERLAAAVGFPKDEIFLDGAAS